MKPDPGSGHGLSFVDLTGLCAFVLDVGFVLGCRVSDLKRLGLARFCSSLSGQATGSQPFSSIIISLSMFHILAPAS